MSGKEMEGEDEEEMREGDMEEEVEGVEEEGETSETVGQWKIKPDGRKTRSIYSVKQSWAERVK